MVRIKQRYVLCQVQPNKTGDLLSLSRYDVQNAIKKAYGEFFGELELAKASSNFQSKAIFDLISSQILEPQHRSFHSQGRLRKYLEDPVDASLDHRHQSENEQDPAPSHLRYPPFSSDLSATLQKIEFRLKKKSKAVLLKSSPNSDSDSED